MIAIRRYKLILKKMKYTVSKANFISHIIKKIPGAFRENNRFGISIIKLLVFIIGGLAFLAGCSSNPPTTVAVTPSPTFLPPPEVHVTETPDVELVLRQYLDAWLEEDYQTMYSLISVTSKSGISEEDFTQRHVDLANEIALRNLDYSIDSSQAVSTEKGEAHYTVTLNSALVGPLTREHQVDIVMEDGSWRIDWNETKIMPELAGGNYLQMDWDTPVRAGIFDRENNPLAAQAEAVAIGFYPDFVDLAEDNGLISLLASLTNFQSYSLYALAEDAGPGTYIPLGEIDADQDARRLDILRTYGAAVTEDYYSRLYFGSGIGPHVTGYVSPIQKEELGVYRRLGYKGDERVGRKGLEAWGNDLLTGVHGGTLYLVNAEGKIIDQLGSTTSQPGKDIVTTLERDFQYRVQKALSGFTGAAVVLERDTGRVLAMASAPGFDQNAFEIENFNWNATLNEILANPNSPQFNRAAEGQYPLGSVFKILTLAAAIEHGGYTVDHTYDCQYDFNELEGLTLYDWTYEDFLEDEVTQPSGLLNLTEGLIRSCNPYYYHMGLDMFNRNLTTAISDMAKGFGLGSKTGIEGIDEEAGVIPEPQSQVDATNLAIGQGDTQVTPLQVARFVAAIGNGGTLYRPQVIERIVPPFGDAEEVFKPDPQGELPISIATLQVLQEAMLGVVRNRNPVGTAYSAFNGLEINVAGKTGTATTGNIDPHAWFAGYTFEENPEKPDIAIVVIAENAGEGSEIAAPIFRRIVEEYFFGAPQRKYWWESIIDVTKSPTVPITDTPTARP